MDAAIKKLRSNDIILILKPKAGEDPKNTKGVVDKRLFTGENRLHLLADKETGFWYFKYDAGIIPEPFKQKFTKLDYAMKFVNEYYSKRNIEIVEVQD